MESWGGHLVNLVNRRSEQNRNFTNRNVNTETNIFHVGIEYD